ncbi:PepSY-associated TM helix domain-containing protein [Silvibacterium sp.]|uniref:PepSY-associated TM helix domain-containing protein n=1 Tax=Silvibacterium sp. TaxID=1964179 RepID=UPI0039E6AE40
MKSFVSDLIHHPRRLFLRRALFQIHLWLGVLLSLYLVLISLSGALMVYHDALTRSTLPSGLAPYDSAHTASVPAVMAAAQAAFPGTVVTYLSMPTARLPVFQLNLHDSAKSKEFQAIADPQTGKPTLLPRSWVDVIYDFHVNLLMGDAHGVQWNGVGAAGLLVLAMSGILLWWRGIRSWWRALGISLRHSWRRVNYDLHHALGLWTVLIVSWWALSGVYFAWDEPFAKAVGVVSPLAGMQEPSPRTPPHADRLATLQEILDTAHKASPQGRLSTISNPSLAPDGNDVYAYMYLGSPEDFGHMDIVRLDAKSGAIVSLWHYGRNRSLGDWFLWAMQPLHFGTLWGPWFRMLWCAFGVALAVLTISGLLMYWNRYLRFRWRDLTAARA